MKMNRFSMILIVPAVLVPVINARGASDRPTLGVQRWDMYSGSEFMTQKQEIGYLPGAQGFLKPEKWHYRAPFYARKTEDVTWVNHPADAGPLWINYPFDQQVLQDNMDQEIDFAADAGIDYFIFNGPTYTLAANGWQLHDNLDAYLTSSKRDRINFVYALYGHNALDYGKTKVDLMLDEIIPYMQSSTWQTVQGNRPLIPVLWPIQFRDMLAAQSGAEQMTLDEFVTRIRQRVMDAGLENPYIVGEEIAHVHDVSGELLAAGFDAMTDYAGAYGGAMAMSEADPVPSYQEATQSLIQKYDSDFLPADLDFIPPVTNQYYPWPRAGSSGVWSYQLPQPGDLADRMKLVFDYVQDYPDDIEAQTVFLYSWNEFSEGGGLAPTMGQAPDYIPVTDQLDELQGVLLEVPLLGDMDCDGNVDFDDIDAFVLALSNPAAYVAMYGLTPEIKGDTDADGDFDFDDIGGFVDLLLGPLGAAHQVPEPAAWVLALPVFAVFFTHLIRPSLASRNVHKAKDVRGIDSSWK